MRQPTVNIDLTKLDMQICPTCESANCCEVFQLRYLPALMSPNGKAQLLKTHVGFVCTQCGESMFEAKVPDTKESKPAIEVIK